MAGSSRLKPGERGSITVRVAFGFVIGKIIKTIEVFSNDPDRPKVILTIEGDN